MVTDDFLREHIIKLIESNGRIEAKIDAVNPKIMDHENRIRKLERFKWLQMGGAAVIGSIVGGLKSIGVL